MATTRKTPNYNLPKPRASDVIDVVDIEGIVDIVDARLKQLFDKSLVDTIGSVSIPAANFNNYTDNFANNTFYRFIRRGPDSLPTLGGSGFMFEGVVFNSGQYEFQRAVSFPGLASDLGGRVYVRGRNAGTWSSWKRLDY